MKKIFALLFVGSMITFAACQSKPKTEETTATASDSAATMATDSAAATVDSAAATVDSTASADTTK